MINKLSDTVFLVLFLILHCSGNTDFDNFTVRTENLEMGGCFEFLYLLQMDGEFRKESEKPMSGMDDSSKIPEMTRWTNEVKFYSA